MPVVLVKGIVTARTLYPDVTLRPISDIDIRLLPHDLPRALDVARSQGWPIGRYSRAYQNLIVTVSGVMLDFEASIGPPGLCGLSIEDLLARSSWMRAEEGWMFRAPELHDHALVLVVNAFKDKLTRAAPWAIRDLELLAESPGFDPDRLVALAEEAASTTMLWVVATWLAQRGDPRWHEVARRIAQPPRPVYARIVQRLVARDGHTLTLRILTRAGSDARLARAQALARAVLWATEAHRAPKLPAPAGSSPPSGAFLREALARNGSATVTCTGRSMEPTLRDGEKVLIERPARARTGEIAVFELGRGLVVHRIVARLGSPRGDVLVHCGDAHWTTAGLVRASSVIGVVPASSGDARIGARHAATAWAVARFGWSFALGPL